MQGIKKKNIETICMFKYVTELKFKVPSKIVSNFTKIISLKKFIHNEKQIKKKKTHKHVIFSEIFINEKKNNDKYSLFFLQ